jgi:hypothetical protein
MNENSFGCGKAFRVWAPPVDLQLVSKARNEAVLPKDLVLYCASHDYGTRILTRTGNLAAVMMTMGHRDVKTAMHYQHPELEVVGAALDYGTPSKSETASAAAKTYGTFHVTPENHHVNIENLY